MEILNVWIRLRYGLLSYYVVGFFKPKRTLQTRPRNASPPGLPRQTSGSSARCSRQKFVIPTTWSSSNHHHLSTNAAGSSHALGSHGLRPQQDKPILSRSSRRASMLTIKEPLNMRSLTVANGMQSISWMWITVACRSVGRSASGGGIVLSGAVMSRRSTFGGPQSRPSAYPLCHSAAATCIQFSVSEKGEEEAAGGTCWPGGGFIARQGQLGAYADLPFWG